VPIQEHVVERENIGNEYAEEDARRHANAPYDARARARALRASPPRSRHLPPTLLPLLRDAAHLICQRYRRQLTRKRYAPGACRLLAAPRAFEDAGFAVQAHHAHISLCRARPSILSMAAPLASY